MKFILVGIVFLLIAYFPILNEGFFLVDDFTLIDSPQLSSSASLLNRIKYILLPGYNVDYYPIRDLSHLIDWIWGINLNYDETPFSIQNIFWIGVISVIFFQILLKSGLSKKIAGFFSTLWMIHPINAEMISWSSSRKDLLAIAFFLFSVFFFIEFLKLLLIENKFSLKWCLLALTFFILSSLSKATFLLAPLFIGIHCAVLIMRDFRLSKQQHAILLLLFLSITGISLSLGLLQKWQYNEVNDMFFDYSLGYRIKGTFAALGKMTLGLIYFPAIIVDCENWGEWADLNLWHLPLGLIIVFSLAYFTFKRRNSIYHVLAFGAFWGVYILTPGPNFLHRNFYSARYFSPLFLILLFLIALEFRTFFSNSKLLRLPKIKIFIGMVCLIFLCLVFEEAKHWHSNISIWDKAVNSTNSDTFYQANSITNRLLTLTQRYKWGQATPEQIEVIKSDFNKLNRNCFAQSNGIKRFRNGSLCATFWTSARVLQNILFGIVNPIPIEELQKFAQLSYDLVDKLSKPKKRIFKISGEINCDDFYITTKKNTPVEYAKLPLPELRAQHLICNCLLFQNDDAFAWYQHLLSLGLIRKIDLHELVTHKSMAEHREKLNSCFSFTKRAIVK